MLITFNKGDVISNKNVDKSLELQVNKEFSIETEIGKAEDVIFILENNKLNIQFTVSDTNQLIDEIIEQLIINYKLYVLEKDDNLSIGAQKLKESYEKLFYPYEGVV